MGHRDAPVRDAASRIGLDDRLERVARFGEPERVQHRDRPVHSRLRLRVAGDTERHRSQLMLVFLRRYRIRSGHGHSDCRQKDAHV
jgi:hypothetical protein